MYVETPRGKFTLFYGHHGPTGAFSNFYNTRIEWREKIFPSSEHCLMYEKAVLFGDAETADLITRAATPVEAKRLGRRVRNFDNDVWDLQRFDIMVAILRVKFANPELGRVLHQTEDATIVECAPGDRIWGIGMGVCDDATYRDRWRGTNLLGEALMRVRDNM
jgi:ribA/ribD-fused uncharacterized protein